MRARTELIYKTEGFQIEMKSHLITSFFSTVIGTSAPKSTGPPPTTTSHVPTRRALCCTPHAGFIGPCKQNPWQNLRVIYRAHLWSFYRVSME
ncbi:hypothetical protein GDO78_011995 [Eleutherodactylus coqui]|uniref:Uncharacterized protein n=1 Tax=Eleutherodactylus coqui TaxID=57060 RepID=A0A8J6K579_ELECQ|nr:hypothetical protein GDO78_011995 [Eleutherodactylus coqui]